jgi:hypothetical protein
MGRAFTDDSFRAFVESPELKLRDEALSAGSENGGIDRKKRLAALYWFLACATCAICSFSTIGSRNKPRCLAGQPNS